MKALLIVVVFAQTAFADRYTEELAKTARYHAGESRCDLARRYAKLVEDRDAAYYRAELVRDRAFGPCVATIEHERLHAEPYEQWWSRARSIRRRVGLDLSGSVGMYITRAVALRFEAGHGAHRFMARVGYLGGFVVENEGPGFNAAIAHIGYRVYATDRVYVGLEAGPAVRHFRRWESELLDAPRPAHWDVWPSGKLSLGLKLAQVEVAIEALVPMFGVGVSLGVDFGRY